MREQHAPRDQERPSSNPPPPSSRSRLRELAERRERVDSVEVRKEIQDHLLTLIHPSLLIGEGQIADVYCGRTDDEMDGFCIKQKVRATEKSPYEKTFQEEMRQQNTAYRLLEDAREEGMSVARVPKAWAYVKTDDGKEILAMERAPGKTLYRWMLEKASEKMPDAHLLQGCRREDIPLLPDRDLEDMVLVRYLNAKGKDHRQLYAALVGKAGEPPFIPAETTLKLRNALKVLGQKNFFHRDLHEKNLILSDDLEGVYMIDFGSSSYQEYQNIDEATNVERIGMKLRYQRDDGILSTILKMTRKPVKKT